jgi:hypothetical protein
MTTMSFYSKMRRGSIGLQARHAHSRKMRARRHGRRRKP